MAFPVATLTEGAGPCLSQGGRSVSDLPTKKKDNILYRKLPYGRYGKK